MSVVAAQALGGFEPTADVSNLCCERSQNSFRCEGIKFHAALQRQKLPFMCVTTSSKAAVTSSRTKQHSG